jgi:hypothetical protein
MKNENGELDPNWHCVEYQRKVREANSELLQRDPEEYYRRVKKAGEDFDARRKAREEKESSEKN